MTSTLPPDDHFSNLVVNCKIVGKRIVGQELEVSGRVNAASMSALDISSDNILANTITANEITTETLTVTGPGAGRGASLTPYVVNPLPGAAPYQTIQAAINAAVADGASRTNPKLILVAVGTYVEDLIIPVHGIQIQSVAENSSFADTGLFSFQPFTVIEGHMTVSASSLGGPHGVEIVNFLLRGNTPGTPVITLTSTGQLSVKECMFAQGSIPTPSDPPILSNPGIGNTTFQKCIFSIGVTGISPFSVTGALNFDRCRMTYYATVGSLSLIDSGTSLVIDHSSITVNHITAAPLLLLQSSGGTNISYSFLRVTSDNPLITISNNTTAIVKHCHILKSGAPGMPWITTSDATGTVTHGANSYQTSSANAVGAGIVNNIVAVV